MFDMDDTLPADYGSPGGDPSQLANLSSSTSLGVGYGGPTPPPPPPVRMRVVPNPPTGYGTLKAAAEGTATTQADGTVSVADPNMVVVGGKWTYVGPSRSAKAAQTAQAVSQFLTGVTTAVQQSGALPGAKFAPSGRAAAPAPVAAGPAPVAAGPDWKTFAFVSVGILAVGGLAWWALKPEETA